VNEEALADWGLSRQKQTNKQSCALTVGINEIFLYFLRFRPVWIK